MGLSGLLSLLLNDCSPHIKQRITKFAQTVLYVYNQYMMISKYSVLQVRLHERYTDPESGLSARIISAEARIHKDSTCDTGILNYGLALELPNTQHLETFVNAALNSAQFRDNHSLLHEGVAYHQMDFGPLIPLLTEKVSIGSNSAGIYVLRDSMVRVFGSTNRVSLPVYFENTSDRSRDIVLQALV